MDFTVGRDGTLDQFADGGTVYPLRVFLAEEKVFVNCGARVSLDVMARECQEIVNRLITLSPGLIEDQGNTTGQERGSSILVLTSRSFDEGSS
jgi:hypothetical protein